MNEDNKNISLRIELDEQYVKDEIARQIKEKFTRELLFMDIDEMERITCMDRAFLTKKLLHHPRIYQYQRRLGGKGKRYWLYKPTVEALLDIITNEWEN